MKKKYEIKPNNYLGTFFVSLVIIASTYILVNVMDNPGIKSELKENNKYINTNEITNESDLIIELQKYLNPGNTNTNKIYQSMYISNDEVTSDKIDEESMLYIAYKYIENNSSIKENNTYLTCETQTNLGLNIINCEDPNATQKEYVINNSVSKEQLTDTVLKIFNRSITNYTNFYIDTNSICYYINEEYNCISQINNNKQEAKTKIYFERAYSNEDTIEIIQTYKYINNNTNYNGFLSDEVGESKYISKFQKINGDYRWISTKKYIEN